MKNESVNLYQRIQAVSHELGKYEKMYKLSLSAGRNPDNLPDFNEIVRIVRLAEKKHGVLSIPVKQQFQSISTRIDGPTSGHTRNIDVVKLTLKIINVDDPSEMIEIESYGNSVNNTPGFYLQPSLGAQKIALINLYKIAHDNCQPAGSLAGAGSIPQSYREYSWIN